MRRSRRLIGACALALAILSATAATAAAQTFYVNQRNAEAEGTATCGLKPGGAEAKKEDPCLKISEAVKKAEAVKGPNTIEVSPEENETSPFKEQIHLTSAADNGLTITGEEPGVRVVVTGTHGAEIGAAAGTVVLSNLTIISRTGPATVLDKGAKLSLVGDTIEGEEVKNGVEAEKGSVVALEGGSVVLENSSGDALSGSGATMSVIGAKLQSGAGGIAPESGGINSHAGVLTVTGSTILLEGSPVLPTFGIGADTGGTALIQNTRVYQGGKWLGVVFENTPVTIEGLKVEMEDPESTTPAVDVENEGLTSQISRLETRGRWKGEGLSSVGGDLTVADSSIATNPAAEMVALRYYAEKAPRGLLLQRSVVQAGIKAPAALSVIRGNATLDSSEILAGKVGVAFEADPTATNQLTISASTIDACAPGIASDAAGTTAVEALAKGAAPTIAKVAIQGSVALEAQAASQAPGDEAAIACSYSAVPGQVQPASAGAISCAAGASGNTEAGPLSSLFPEPLSGYSLAPGSTAVDSVPAAAIALPFGLTPSSTDLAGNPRVVDGNGDCVAVQDRGALELQGHAAPCPPAPVPAPGPGPKPVAGVISALSISPSTFAAAPSGATASARKKYGAKVSWRDSQAATTTFTVLAPGAGRIQGHSCKKPSSKNRHGRRCTLYRALGTFTHADRAGADSLHFSGRLHGRRLPRGSYRLQAVARDLAGNGPAVRTSFRIR